MLTEGVGACEWWGWYHHRSHSPCRVRRMSMKRGGLAWIWKSEARLVRLPQWRIIQSGPTRVRRVTIQGCELHSFQRTGRKCHDVSEPQEDPEGVSIERSAVWGVGAQMVDEKGICVAGSLLWGQSLSGLISTSTWVGSPAQSVCFQVGWRVQPSINVVTPEQGEEGSPDGSLKASEVPRASASGRNHVQGIYTQVALGRSPFWG